MNEPHSQDQIEEEAARWVLRQDRGLTAEEQDEFVRWLAADTRHRHALTEHRWSWDELDRVAGIDFALPVGTPAALVPKPRQRGRTGLVLAGSMAAALVLGLFLHAPPRPETMPFSVEALVAPCERRVLADGSVLELNRGAVLRAEYTDETRRVVLERGEAYFVVASDPLRPFIVHAAGIDVRAVGTMFNVRLEREKVDVLVAEGRVRVATSLPQAPHAGPRQDAPLVEAMQLASVATRADAVPRIATLTPREVETQLRWRPRMLEFTEARLPEIVHAFNAHNSVQLTVADARLQEFRLTATFRSDNLEGFVRLMEAEFGLRAEWRGPLEIVLTQAR